MSVTNKDTMYQEVWKPHKTLILYEVSNYGRVRNHRGKILKVNTLRNNRWIPLSNTETKKKENWSITRLLHTHFPYEWIKDLEEGEECKEIVGHPGYYITTRGRIWNSREWKWNTPIRHLDTYYWKIKLNNTSNTIHKLVGRHFLPEYKEGLFILHRDEELPFPQINYVENLWVGTPKDNSHDMMSKGRGGGFLTS